MDVAFTFNNYVSLKIRRYSCGVVPVSALNDVT